MLRITREETARCLALTILYDDIPEPVENFTLRIESVDPGINVVPSTGELTIYIGEHIGVLIISIVVCVVCLFVHVWYCVL